MVASGGSGGSDAAVVRLPDMGFRRGLVVRDEESLLARINIPGHIATVVWVNTQLE